MEAKIFNFTGYGAQNPNHKRKINELTRALTQQGHHDTVDHLSKVNDGELLIVAGSYSTRLATMLKMHVTVLFYKNKTRWYTRKTKSIRNSK